MTERPINIEVFALRIQQYTKRQKLPNKSIHQTARSAAALTRLAWVGRW
jgi:hypothetical protein